MKVREIVSVLKALAGVAAITVGVALWLSVPVALVVLGVLVLVDVVTDRR